MKIETAKTLALGLTIGALLMVFAIPYTQAGPQPSAPRTVPTVLQSFVPPSKMVAIGTTLHPTDVAGVVQPDIVLEPGEVFILMSVSGRVANSRQTSSSLPAREGLRGIRRGDPTGPFVAYAKAETSFIYTSSSSVPFDSNFFQTVYPCGIRFVRLPNGKADLFLVGLTASGATPADLPDVTLQGYITNDF